MLMMTCVFHLDFDSKGPFALLLNYTTQELPWSADAVSGVRRRLNDSVVEGLVRGGNTDVYEIHAPMGSVVLFEISSVHRGMPCARGARATVTNYYKVAKASTTCHAGASMASSPFAISN